MILKLTWGRVYEIIDITFSLFCDESKCHKIYFRHEIYFHVLLEKNPVRVLLHNFNGQILVEKDAILFLNNITYNIIIYSCLKVF